MQLRAFEADDEAGVDALLKAAFPGPGEARLVTALRAADADTLELVAVDHGSVVGSIMFSPVTARPGSGDDDLFGVGLGPVAVVPEHQARGIGVALIEAGLTYLTTLGVPWCVLLGDPDYYKRLGFAPFFPVAGKRFEIPHPDVAVLPQSGLPRLLREARLGAGLTKREAAKRLGVCVDVVGQWERGEHAPRIHYYPILIEFLGNDDWLEDRTLADRIRKCRARNGWSQAMLGHQIGVSETTIARWEKGHGISTSTIDRVQRLLANSVLEQAQPHPTKCSHSCLE
jgi:putative acetyltransferase